MSVLQCETRGRRPGGRNSPEQKRAARYAMKEYHLLIKNRPWECQGCGVRVTDRADLERFGGQWLCGECLNGDAEPIRIEDYCYQDRGTQDYAIGYDRHVHVDEPEEGCDDGEEGIEGLEAEIE